MLANLRPLSLIYSCVREDGVAHFVAEPHLEPPLVITLSFIELITVPVVCGPPMTTCQVLDAAFIKEVDLLLRALAVMLRMMLDVVRAELPHTPVFTTTDLFLPIPLLIL